MKKNIISKVLCVLGIILVFAGVIINSDKQENKDDKSDGNAITNIDKEKTNCKEAFDNNQYKMQSLDSENRTVTFSLLDCVSEVSSDEYVGSYESNEKDYNINLLFRNTDINNLADIVFYNYSIKENYPDYYLFSKDKKNINGIDYKLILAKEVDADGTVLYNYFDIIYPIDNNNSLNLKLRISSNLFENEEFIEKVANSIIVTHK